MKTRRATFIGALGCFAAICFLPNSLAARATPSFAGTWEGKMNDLPVIDLKIDQAGGKVSGVIVFYFHERSDPQSPWQVASESTKPLVAPRLEGDVLTFEVEHHKRHGSPELGPNVKFRVELAGPNEARLWKLDDQEADRDLGLGLKLTRQTSMTTGVDQALQKGVSVELAITRHAVAMPDADNLDALVVAVTRDGSVYFGIDPITLAELAEKNGLSSGGGEKLYIKADARTPYADVMKVLDAVRKAGVAAPNLLTGQPKKPQPGKLVPPKGMEVLVGQPQPSGGESTVVQVLSSGEELPVLRINNEDVPWAALEGSLRQLFMERKRKEVLVKADGRLPFARVAHVIDVCRSVGSKVFLATSAT